MGSPATTVELRGFADGSGGAGVEGVTPVVPAFPPVQAARRRRDAARSAVAPREALAPRPAGGAMRRIIGNDAESTLRVACRSSEKASGASSSEAVGPGRNATARNDYQ
jgi:hypothetical protein